MGTLAPSVTSLVSVLLPVLVIRRSNLPRNITVFPSRSVRGVGIT